MALLSIIIPTRNRQYYAFECAKTISEFISYDSEIVIQDNSNDDSLRSILLDSKIKNIKYSYTPGEISFCDNFSYALEQSTGKYCIFIGDDDCVLPYIFDVVVLANEKNIDSIRYSKDINYMWPGATTSTECGHLVIRDVFPYISMLDTSTAINDMLHSGNYDYQRYKFPFVYHGIVKREILDKIKEKTGHYFGGLTPDIYASVSLSFYVKYVLYINFPLSISGICSFSGSADGITGRHNGEMSQAPHFRGTHNYSWDKNIPYVYSVQTIWAETALKAMKENNYVPSMSQKEYYNYTVCLIDGNPIAKSQYIDFYKNKFSIKNNIILLEFLLSTYKFKVKKVLIRGYNYLKRIIRGRHSIKNVNNIQEAVKITVSYFDKKNIFFTILEQIKKERYVDK